MDAELQAFEDARATRSLRTDYDGDHRTRDQHKGTAADLARAYVGGHPELAKRYASFGIERLVQLLDGARDRGDPETVAEIDAWLMATHPPQRIGSSVAT